ncbi:MAG: L-seryl-tRNA(Sec) selenium transferase [Clostridiales bacterium]|nr:L-seryl-tRNA(Sec) selenium transferase [Clostridiales bacterium]
MSDKKEILRKLPKTDEMLQDEHLLFFTQKLSARTVADTVRNLVADYREKILSGEINEAPDKDTLIEETVRTLRTLERGGICRVVNATGIVLHTNLGRAVLSERGVKAADLAASGYTNLEYDLEKGCRNSRQSHVEDLLTEITGGEAAIVVNNNAAGVLLCLFALAHGKNILVSRGELVEIGGGFRVPEIMELSGGILKEVGTTNRTRISDYEKAITEDTGAILKVHKSNFKMVGFTEEASLSELRELGDKYNLPVIYDYGGGLMTNLGNRGVREQSLMEIMKAKPDVVLFSGDKLFGGPQAGIAVGTKEAIRKMSEHPLSRALRLEKMTLAALEGTLIDYLDMKSSIKMNPTLHMITVEKDELRLRAEHLKDMLTKAHGENEELAFSVTEVEDKIGGGAAPDAVLSGYGVVVTSDKTPIMTLEKELRLSSVPIITRIRENALVISVRTLLKGDEEAILCAFKERLKTC